MELDDCAFPTARRRRDRRRRDEGLRRRQPRPPRRRPPARPRHGARRPPRGQRRHLRPAGQGAQRGGGRRHPHHGDGNPANTNALIAMSNAPDIPTERFSALTRPRPQPRDLAARREAPRAGHRDQEDDDLGQPLRHPVPRPLPRRGRRPERRRAVGDEAWLPTPSSPPSPSAAPRSSRRGAPPRPPPPRRRPSTTLARGCRAPPRATGSRWRSAPTVPTASPEGLISSFPVDGRPTASGRSSRAWRSTTSPAGRSTPRCAELAEERDAVRALNLI